eukprot:3445316-Rhodomonas_salina.1
MGRHIDTSRSLRISTFAGESEHYEIEPRGSKTSADEIAEHRRRQFQHGTREEQQGAVFRCRLRSASATRRQQLLDKPVDHLAEDLVKSGEVLRFKPEMWNAGDRDKPAGGNGWAMVVMGHRSTEHKSRMLLHFIDPQA